MKSSSRLPAIAHVGLLLLSVSCSSRSSQSISAKTSTAESPKAAPVLAAPGTVDAGSPPIDAADERAVRAAVAKTARAIERVLCAEAPCCVTGLDEMGADHKGQELFVAELDGKGECLAPHRRAAAGAETPDKDGDNVDQPCKPAQFHLVARKGGRVRDVAWLAESCNIPADFPEAGDSIEVDREKKLVSRSSGGGAAIWWGASVTVGLDPLRLVRIQKDTFDRTDHDNTTDESWDWDAFAGTSQWGALDCKAMARTGTEGRRADAEAPAKDEQQNPARLDIHAVRIPSVDLPAAFLAGAWRTVSLGACSASFDYSIYGAGDSDDQADIRARAVVGGNTLFVEVWDDRFVGPGKNWVKDDHLELWLGHVDLNDQSCDTEKPQIAQWGIRVADGAVFSAFASPKPLVGVERVLAKHGARFKIPLPADGGDRMTVVYSNGDGRRQTHVIATSELHFGDPATLGETFVVEATHAVCVVKGGALETKRVPLKPSTSAALMDGWL